MSIYTNEIHQQHNQSHIHLPEPIPLASWQSLYDLGFSLIPLKPCGKTPLVKWTEYQTTRASWPLIEQWLQKWPDANIGIVTGEISNLTVIDFDTPEAFEAAVRDGWIGDAVIVETGDGYHAYYQHPGGDIRCKTELFPNVDVRAEGGYAVAPPSIHESGKTYCWLDDPSGIAATKMSGWLHGRLLEAETPQGVAHGPSITLGNVVLDREVQILTHTAEGGRNDQLNHSAFKVGQLIAQGSLDAQLGINALTIAAQQMGLADPEISRTIISGIQAGLTAPILEKTVSEVHIAKVFTQLHSHEAKFCHTADKWYWFDGSHWMPSETGVERFILREIATKESGGKASSSKNSVVSGAENLAKVDPAHTATSKFWDNDPYLLGTTGGTIDLRSGKLRKARPEDGITKITACAPEQGEPELWLRFLLEASGGDADMVAYLQRVCGYILTGDTCEHALFFIHGYGGNGKSVFLNTIAGILGDYAKTASMDTFTVNKFQQHSTDLAMLKGARLVTASETEAGKPWAEARIKQMTGGDPITARFLYCDHFTFLPQFKLLIVGNHAPKLSFVDDAIRRRFNILPFVHKPQNPDKHLEMKLKAEWPKILNWMIQGCLIWKEQGLNPPTKVILATEEFFEEQDVFGQWLKTKCHVNPKNEKLKVPCGTVFLDWANFAEENGEEPGDAKLLGSRLKRLGILSRTAQDSKTGKKVKHYFGIQLFDIDPFYDP